MKDFLVASVIACLLAALGLAYFDVLIDSSGSSCSVARAPSHHRKA